MVYKLEPIPRRESWSPIDEALYGPAHLYNVEAGEAKELGLNAVQFSVNYHYHHNNFYRTLCEHRGFSPEEVKTREDFSKIPLVPDNIFKGYPEPTRFISWLKGIMSNEVEIPKVIGSTYDELIERLNENGIYVTFSSGSSGRNTFVPIDTITFSRERYIRQYEPKNYGQPEAFIYLAPNLAGSNWSMAYTLFNHVVPNLRDTLNMKKEMMFLGITARRVTVDTFQNVILTQAKIEEGFHQIISILDDVSRKGVTGYICTTPALLLNFLSFLDNLNIKFNLGHGWFMQTGGGWKKATAYDSQTIRTSHDELAMRSQRGLGIPKENCQDIYCMCECRVPFLPCQGNYKHVPLAVLHPFVLDEDLEPIGFGEYGRFAFLDTLAHSYPGFIITGDKVKLYEHCPSCDRPGPVIDPEISRMPETEDKGCANLIQKLIAEETSKI